MRPDSSTLEIPLDEPCAEHRDALLDLIGTIPGERIVPSAVASRHLRTCTRCSRFLASARSQRNLTRSVFLDWERTRSRERVGLEEFPGWMERRLEASDARREARIRWTTARSILIRDPTYRSKFVIATSENKDQRSWSAMLARGVVSDRPQIRGSRAQSAGISVTEGVRLARQLLAFSSRRSGRFVELEIATASIEWHYGDQAAVPLHLERAIAASRTADARGRAIGMLALWKMDASSVGDALELNRTALMSTSTIQPALLNHVVWHSVLDNESAVRTALARLLDRSGVMPVGIRRALHRTGRCLRNTAERMAVPVGVAERRGRALIPWFEGR